MPWVMHVLKGNYLNEYGRQMLGEEVKEYVKAYNLEFARGTGVVETTVYLAEAKRWPTQLEVMRAWKEQSKLHPLRPDGRPNRPLTALTISAVEVDD